MVKYCSKCGRSVDENYKFCSFCGAEIKQKVVQEESVSNDNKNIQAPTTPTSSVVSKNMWYKDQYRIRKKVLTVGNKYWIEDPSGNLLGFCKQKILKLKEDIRIYSDETMSDELFNIKQEQMFDAWGSFAITDSKTNQPLGYIKRGFLSEFGRDAWEIQNVNKQPIGRIFEQSMGRALARKYLPGGKLVPEQMQVELNNQTIAQVNQQFKIIGDIWDIKCMQVPDTFDRRVMLGCILLMGTIERSRK